MVSTQTSVIVASLPSLQYESTSRSYAAAVIDKQWHVLAQRGVRWKVSPVLLPLDWALWAR